LYLLSKYIERVYNIHGAWSQEYAKFRLASVLHRYHNDSLHAHTYMHITLTRTQVHLFKIAVVLT
jgi:hypothetical protein